jgi:hypothetical protein
MRLFPGKRGSGVDPFQFAGQMLFRLLEGVEPVTQGEHLIPQHLHAAFDIAFLVARKQFVTLI